MAVGTDQSRSSTSFLSDAKATLPPAAISAFHIIRLNESIRKRGFSALVALRWACVSPHRGPGILPGRATVLALSPRRCLASREYPGYGPATEFMSQRRCVGRSFCLGTNRSAVMRGAGLESRTTTTPQEFACHCQKNARQSPRAREACTDDQCRAGRRDTIGQFQNSKRVFWSTPHSPRPDGFCDAKHDAIGVEPNNINGPAHPERVDATCRIEQQSMTFPQREAKLQSREASQERIGDLDISSDSLRRILDDDMPFLTRWIGIECRQLQRLNLRSSVAESLPQTGQAWPGCDIPSVRASPRTGPAKKEGPVEQ